jgi:hypothetical protein
MIVGRGVEAEGEVGKYIENFAALLPKMGMAGLEIQSSPPMSSVLTKTVARNDDGYLLNDFTALASSSFTSKTVYSLVI